MGFYLKRHRVIEAKQNLVGNAEEISTWLKGHGADVTFDGAAFFILTLEGVMRADRGDWIIRGVKGEFYPCKPDIFAESFDPM